MLSFVPGRFNLTVIRTKPALRVPGQVELGQAKVA